MNSIQDGPTSSKTGHPRETIRRIAILALKVTGVIGTVILWFIVIQGADRLLSEPKFWARARIEILGAHDRFDPRVWFEENVNSVQTSSVREHAEALKSRDLAKSVIAAMRPDLYEELMLTLRDSYSGKQAIAANLKSSQVSINPENKRSYRLADYVCENLIVKQVSSCNMIDLYLKTPNQSLSIELLNLYLKQFNAFNLEKRRMQTMESVENLEEGVRETRHQLKEAEAKLLEFVVENGFYTDEGSGLGHVFNLINRLVGGPKCGDRQISVKNSHFMAQNPVSTAPDKMDLIHRMSADLRKLEAEQSGLTATLGLNHPRMMSLAGKITFLRKRIEYFRQNFGTDPTMTMEPDREPTVVRNDDETTYKTTLIEAKSLAQQYSDLKRDLDIKSDFCRLVQQEAQKWSVKIRTISNNIVVIDGPRDGKPGWWLR